MGGSEGGNNGGWSLHLPLKIRLSINALHVNLTVDKRRGNRRQSSGLLFSQFH